MQITAKGQVTIPQSIREKYGFLPHTEIEFIEANGIVILSKISNGSTTARKMLQQMRGRQTTPMSTDAIMKLTRG